MKGLVTLVMSGLLVVSSVSFANDVAKTSMTANWQCTTNASSAETDAGKNADKKMSETYSSAKDAFKMAQQNCRDCTEITCKVKS